MIIKVCGISNHQQLEQLDELNVQWIGLNFYRPSKRYYTHTSTPRMHQSHLVGVFVDASKNDIMHKVKTHQLDLIQLHGNEDITFINHMSEYIPTIHVIKVKDSFPIHIPKNSSAQYFLFDTQCATYGGSGKVFDWQKIDTLPLPKPFLLSGGISPHHVKELAEFNHPDFIGVDINSQFEHTPGHKDINMIHNFISQLHSFNHNS